MYAKDLSQAQRALGNNKEVRSRMEDLIRFSFIHDPILNSSRKNLKEFRSILLDLTNARISGIDKASSEVRRKIFTRSSNGENGVSEIDVDWPLKITNLHFSRFYNQAVLSYLIAKGQKECYIHHTLDEDLISGCEMDIAGRRFNVIDLFSNLLYKYEYGEKINGPVIPGHPLCTHVVSPIFLHIVES